MDYSELVFAIKEGDMQTANKRCAEAIPILKKYLISTLNASEEDAEDAVQRMFEYVIPKIQNEEISSPSGLLSYMLTGSRHSYYKIYRDYEYDNYEEIKEDLVSEPQQVWNLISEDQESILYKCLSKLKSHYRELMEFLFDYPEAVPEDIAEYFDISLNNAWIRKHRAVQQLNECVSKFFQKKL
jgi:DNA-directed RNA polymerase specialized sigma24 family protein